MSQLEQLAKAVGRSIPSVLESIAENIQLGLYVYRLEDGKERETLTLLYANPASAQLTGVAVEESLNRTLDELFPGLTQKGVSKLFAEVVRSGQPRTISEFHYGDERVSTAVWTFKAFPLPDRCVGVAFENITPIKQAEEEIRRQFDRLTALRNIDLAIIGSLDLKVTLQVFLDQVTSQLNIDAADVLLLSPQTQTLDFAAGRGFRRSGIRRTRIRLDEGFPGAVAREGRAITVPDLQKEKVFLRSALVEGEDFVAYCGVPLVAKGALRGVLELFHRSALDRDEDWLEFLTILAGQAAIAVDNAFLYESLQRSNAELALAYDRTLEGWAHALELRDLETEGHARRVTELTVSLARAMKLPEDQLVHMRRGALLHDIGKIAIPDSILLKPGPLTDEEREIMRRHPVHAYELLSPIAFLSPALDIPYCHHERWDGQGYPRGIVGEQIPLAARVFAVVDAWDAMRSDRPYRKALSEEKALRQIREGAGTQFDPRIAETFVETWESEDSRGA